MIYRGEFGDINGGQYRIIINTGGSNSGSPTALLLSETPCVITTQSDGIFDPIKPSTCTISILTKTFIPELYSETPHGVEVTVSRVESEGTENEYETIVFHGWATPCIYSQGYTYIDTLEIEAVDAISSLQYYDYTTETEGTRANVSVISILKRACLLAGYGGFMNWINGFNNFNVLTMCVNEGNFFDDDEEETPWKWLEVVEEICKYLGWSCVPFGDNVYFTDYRYLANVTQTQGQYRPWNYSGIDLSSANGSSNSIPAYGWQLNWNYVNLPVASGSPKISLDEVFNKIEITSNTYDLDDLIPGMDENHISINKEQGEFNYSAAVVNSYGYKNWFWGKQHTKYAGMPGFWSAYCRFDENKPWKHHYYNIRDCSAVSSYKYDNYRDPRAGALTSQYQTSSSNKMINTVCALPCHYSFDGTNTPSVSWSDCLMILKYNDLAGIDTRARFKIRENTLAELSLLTYENDDSLILKPSSGTTWISIKGDLFYQRNQRVETSGSGNYNYLQVVNSDVYATVPFDTSVKIGEQTFEPDYLLEYSDSLGAYRDTSDSNYKDGFHLLPMKVSVGDKWWNGSSWQDTECIFYLSHTNEPNEEAEDLKDRCETVQTLKWMKLVPNTTYLDKVGEEAYAIPIRANNRNDPSGGRIKIELCTPRFIPEEWHDLWPSLTPRQESQPYSFASGMGPCCYLKGFEVNIVYTDTSVWWLTHNNVSNDIVYYNDYKKEFSSNEDVYCNELNSIELKINSSIEEKPISKSFVSDGERYISGVRHLFGDEVKTQEKNLIDMYYEHYSKPCKIYTFNIRDYINPYHRLTFGSTISGEFVVDSQNYDLRMCNNEITVIEYKSDLD